MVVVDEGGGEDRSNTIAIDAEAQVSFQKHGGSKFINFLVICARGFPQMKLIRIRINLRYRRIRK